MYCRYIDFIKHSRNTDLKHISKEHSNVMFRKVTHYLYFTIGACKSRGKFSNYLVNLPLRRNEMKHAMKDESVCLMPVILPSVSMKDTQLSSSNADQYLVNR
uniref:Uncharacterized protein n=1 Tax=Cacopsylla melanoneura TaxID=428564 RepID=A0A8D9B0S3_9HEMI